jgi:hypothetical protein
MFFLLNIKIYMTMSCFIPMLFFIGKKHATCVSGTAAHQFKICIL